MRNAELSQRLFTSAATRFQRGSPWREPWEKCAAAKSPVSVAIAFPATGGFFRRFATPIFLCLKPTADAVGYLLPLLRSYLPPFSKTDLCPRHIFFIQGCANPKFLAHCGVSMC